MLGITEIDNKKKFCFIVSCLKRYVVQFLNIFSANKFAILCSEDLVYCVC
jgi:hypothetical protein